MNYRLAIVYPGDGTTWRDPAPQRSRFAPLVAAFETTGVEVQPVLYHDAVADQVRDVLRGVDGALVWVNPNQGGRPRDTLDGLLRDVSRAGVCVSAHPDVILKIGTKDVLVDTRDLDWGSDCHRVESPAQLSAELPGRLSGGAARVLKQWRGHSGMGVWRAQRLSDPHETGRPTRLLVRHAQRGCVDAVMTLEEFVARMTVYFEHGGHMVDQEWQPRLAEGMVRCYLVQDRVVGFGLQEVNALCPVPDGRSLEDSPSPSPRHYHPHDLASMQPLKRRLEVEWVPALQSLCGLGTEHLPLLWDCDFLRREHTPGSPDRYVLCEINVSSVAPFPDSAIAPLIEATIARLGSARRARRAR